MNRSRALALLGLGVSLMIIAGQVLSNGTCTYSITGGSASVTSPSIGACKVLLTDFSAEGSYRLNWSVTGATGGTPCDASVNWQISGETSDTGSSCGFTDNNNDLIQNANIGSTGSFSRTRGWTCSPVTIGTWSLTARTKYSGSSYGSGSISYKVKNSCP